LTTRPNFLQNNYHGKYFLILLLAFVLLSSFVIIAHHAFANSSNTGILEPLYSLPYNSTGGFQWSVVNTTKADYPHVPYFVVINPYNGPGISSDRNYTNGIGNLTKTGVNVLGYVSTCWCGTDMNQTQKKYSRVVQEINEWLSWYPTIKGIYLDDFRSYPFATGNVTYYQNLTNYIHNNSIKNLPYSFGNPGTDVDPRFKGTVDTLNIFEENKTLPSNATLQGTDQWHIQFDKNNFSFKVYCTDQLPPSAWFSARSLYVGLMFIEQHGCGNSDAAAWTIVPSQTWLSTIASALNFPSVVYNINAVDQAGITISPGMSIQINQSNNLVRTGFNPISYNATSGWQYKLTAELCHVLLPPATSVFKFDHWNNNPSSNNSTIFISSTTNQNEIAHYISTTSCSSTAPQPPTGLTATAVSSSQNNLSWTAPANNGSSTITGYKIERSTDVGSSWSVIVSSTGSTATTYSDSGLIPNTTYTYRVSAINSAGTSSPSNITSATTPSSIRPINQVKSGLTASDPLNNETKTQQQLQANPRYWTYGGEAPLQTPPAPYDFYKDPQGLHIAVQSTGNDTNGNPKWAGFYALAPSINASLFHAVISTPVRSIPNNYYENSLYVQSNVNVPNALVNYVACGSNTATSYGTVWTVYSATGDANGATTFARLFADNSTNQSLTRDCTIITNGSNYLKVYLDGVMIYSSNNLNLQMQEPFNVFLEPQSSYAGQLLNGIYKDYYVTTDENIQVTNLPSNAARVDLTDTSCVLASAPMTGGAAKLDVGKYHFPLAATIKVYDSNNIIIASTSTPVSIFGGDVYSVS